MLDTNDYLFFTKVAEMDIDKLKILKQRLENSIAWQGFGIFEQANEKLIYYCWLNKQSNYYVKEFYKTLSFNTDEILFEDDFTLPEYRGRGLHRYAMYQRLKYCSEQNIDTAYIIIECGNTPALKTIHDFGFKKKTVNPFTYRKGSVRESFYLLRKKIISH